MSYTYRAWVDHHVDGDSVALVVDLGFAVFTKQLCRLVGINTREKNEPGGPEAGAHLAMLLPLESEVTVTSVKVDKYGGRFDGKLATRTVPDVALRMVADGYAALWNGKGPRPVPPWPILETT